MTKESKQPDARIVSLATAVPPHRVGQSEAMEFFQRSFEIPQIQRDRLNAVFVNAAIDTRYAAAPIGWYDCAHSFPEKNDLYVDTAVSLLKQVTVETLAGAGLACSDVDMLVIVSSTGIAVPTLDARLMEGAAVSAQRRAPAVVRAGLRGERAGAGARPLRALPQSRAAGSCSSWSNSAR